MEVIHLIFKIGVLLAIYGFIWFFINLLISLATGGRKKTIGEVYFSKVVKSIFLVNVLFLYGLDDGQNEIDLFNMIVSGLVLILYFVGQMQKNEQQAAMMEKYSNLLRGIGANSRFNKKAEIIVLSISVLFYTSLFYLPEFAKNPIALWFYETVTEIEKTPLIGFIFKIIGFFFLLSILVKIFNGFNYLISGKPFINVKTGFYSGSKKDKDDDSFDDFEEIKNELPEDKS
ncbi:MAG: hypothetical protein ACKO7D_02500 [Bacteroidota bacterium]